MRPLSAERQRQELLDSKHQLERVIGKPVRLFSYPFGNRRDFSEQTMALAREVGYEAAIANVQGSLGPSFDPFAVPRRLVRNWSDSVFATWMGEADKDRLEQATLEVRFRGSP